MSWISFDSSNEVDEISDLAKKLQGSTNYNSIEKKYGKSKMCDMIKFLNTFTRLQIDLNSRLIDFLERFPVFNGSLLHKKALGIARSIGFESYVGSFAGLWTLLSKTSIKFNRMIGTLPDNYTIHYEEEEETNGLIENTDDSIDIIEYLPFDDTQEYVMEMIPFDNFTEEIIFLDDQAVLNVEDHEERGTKRSIEQGESFSTTVKKGRMTGDGFYHSHS